MNELELLRTVRPAWLARVLHMARGTSLREDFRNQVVHFYEMLEQAVESGDNSWLDQVLSIWASSLTQTDLESESGVLSEIIKELSILTYSVIREVLSSEDAVVLLDALFPILAYSNQKAAQLELKAQVTYISNKLEEVQQTLEKLDQSKSDFIAVAAHELKTPLTLIEGYTSMLQENCQDSLVSQSVGTLVTGIHTGVNRLRIIIDDMIDVSMIDNNLMALNFQPVWINRLLSSLHQDTNDSLQERNLALEIQDFSGGNQMIFGDPERLTQVFRNLVSNAIKFTPDGGKILIHGKVLPGFIEVIIRDTGIGISIEDQALIFNKFSRRGNIALHSSGKTKFKGGGPGLGLHIAKGIIESHGGAIWVESEGYDEKKCPGSTFHILIPARSEPPDAEIAQIFAPLISAQKQKDK
jgi:signal transduction histidine kinase